MISVTHFRDVADEFGERVNEALAALATRPGFLRGSVGRSTDDTADWVLVTEWENVGSYRRALGNYDVKLRATPLLGQARDLPTSFETLADALPGVVATHESDHA